MCMLHESTYSYSGCRLEDQETEPAQGEPNTQLPKSLLQRITMSIIRDKDANTAPPSDPLQVDELSTSTDCSTHIVKESIIIQCSTASGDIQLNPDPAKRRCADLQPITINNDRDGREAVMIGNASLGLSTFVGDCPVCEAAEQAVKEALEKQFIKPQSPTLVDPNLRNSHPPTGAFRDNRPVDSHHQRRNARTGENRTRSRKRNKDSRRRGGCSLM